MSFSDNLQYNLENASLYFQGGVRRSILIFTGVCLVLLTPTYFIGQLSSNLWYTLPINPNFLKKNNIVVAKQLKESEVSIDRSNSTPLITGENVLYTFIDNKANKTIGYYPFVYRKQILDKSGAVISDSVSRTYLLPGEVRYVSATYPSDQGNEIRIQREPETNPVLYNPNANQLLRDPKIEIRNPKILDSDEQNIRLLATFKNLDQVIIGEVNLVILIRDSQDSIVGLKEYTFTRLLPEEERGIDLTYPKPKNREAKLLDIRMSVNYLDPKNIVLK